MRITPDNLLVIVLVSSRGVSATVAWLQPDRGEKVVAHKQIDCVWHALSDRGKRQTVADAVKLACESAGVEAYSAYIGMQDPSIRSQLALGYADLGQEMPFTAAERDQALLRARHQAIGEDRELLHALPVLWMLRTRQGEREVVDPIGERGARLTAHVLLVTARAGYAAEMEALLRACDLGCDGVIAPPLALYNGISGKLPRRGSTVVIDMGARHTSLLVHRKGRLIHLETHAFGGDHLTWRLAEELGLPFEAAEDLKREVDISNHGTAGDHEGQLYLWREVQERHRLLAPAARICAALAREFFVPRAQELREHELIGQHGAAHLVGRASALGGLSLFLRDVFDLQVVLGTGSREREPSAELTDLVVSGAVRTAADQRLAQLSGSGRRLRSAAAGFWGWLARPIE